MIAVLWLTGLLTASVWYMTGIGYGLLTLALVGAGSLLWSDEIIFGDDDKRGRR